MSPEKTHWEAALRLLGRAVRGGGRRRRSSRGRRRMAIRTAGRTHDLAVLFDRVNGEFFGGRIEARVTWGRDTRGRPVRQRRLGSWRPEEGLIVIHPVLDDPRVPEYVVLVTLHHEMLHALQPARTRRPHDAAFHRAERTHPDYRRARAWKRENLDLLLGRGEPPPGAP